jgi:hypothetical protein
MRFALIFTVVAATSLLGPAPGARTDPPTKASKVVRPAIWWPGVGRISDGGGPGLKPTIYLITDAEAFAKLWKKLGLKGELPRVNFQDYFVLVDSRRFGLDFAIGGGLAVDERGDARAGGFRADPDARNSAVHSTTIGVFPRAGIKSVGGKKLPVSKAGLAGPEAPEAGPSTAGSPLDQLVLQDVTPQERQELPNEAVAVIRREGKGAAYLVGAFSSDDTRLALGTNDGAVELWGLEGGKPKRLAEQRPADKAGPVSKLAFSRDGQWLATIHGSVGGFLALWKLDKYGGSLVDTLKLAPRMDEVTFHPGGKVLVCSSPRDGKDLPVLAKCYAVSDKALRPLKGEFEGAMQRFTFTPDGKFAAIYFTPERNGPLYGSEVMLWTFSEKTQAVAVHQKIRLESGIRAMAFTHDGKRLATGSLDQKVRLWDLTQRPPSVAKMFDVPIWARDLAFTANDSHLFVFSGGMNMLLWNVAAGKIAQQWDLKNDLTGKLGAGAINASAVASDGRHILYSRFMGPAVILRLPIR